ncbi:MAG TPA: hypothetical protein HPQ03_13980 [Deltaproteobacteria bacterium]|nr:hypothetical protein [Deltaproteobacteria bacterium]
MTLSTEKHRFPLWIDLLLLLGLEAFLLIYFDARYMLYDTVVTGGDTASWHNIAHHLSKVLLPNFRLTGWDMGNFCGYPNFNFYFLPPFLLAVIPSNLFGIPLTISLKWVIMSGIFLLPVATYSGLRNMGYRFPAPIIGSAGSLLFVFNEFYTMFGGNTLSTFAGEFCYMFTFALFILFIGTLYRGIETGAGMIKNGLLLGAIGLSHLFVFIPALMIMVFAFFRGKQIKYILGVGTIAFVCMAFWILPLMAYRHPYTTPVYMIWKDFDNLRYSLVGILIIVLAVGPRFALHVIKLKDSHPVYPFWVFILLIFSGSFAAAYLTGKYLALGEEIWLTGLAVSDYSKSPLGQMIGIKLDMWVIPISVVIAILVASNGIRAVFRNDIARFSRIFGAFCFSGMIFLCLLGFHWAIIKNLHDLPLKETLLNPGLMIGIHGMLSAGMFYYFGISRKFTHFLNSALENVSSQRFFLWLTVVFGCIVAYFSAHFLQVPDIRFLPPLGFALILLLLADTLNPFLAERRIVIRAAFGITACYLAVIVVIFGPQRASNWYRFNNKGYEMAAGYQEFQKANQYLRTVYEKEGLDPLNAPRVGYEKCDLYGRYGGDRAFESLQYFSGRQTLEGIHYASSISSRFMAFIQTEFSRDVKTPKPQILSKVNTEALPKHFDLYNLSQLVVATDTAKKALNRSKSFRKEAEFGQLSIYRYEQCDGRYVDIPKFRPVLYKGKNWVDDFFTWYKDADRTDVLLVPEQFVKDPEDRKIFAGVTDSVFELDYFRSNRIDGSGFQIDAHLDHDKIQFTTNKPGLPHLIKVSYFHNWKVKGAYGVYPVSPHLMMVIPRSKTVILEYGRSKWEVYGIFITVCGLLLLILYKRISAFSRKRLRGFEKIHLVWERSWISFERVSAQIKPVLLIIFLSISLILIISGLMLRNKPVRVYVAGYQAYILGVNSQKLKKNDQANAYFNRAINIMQPLLTDRYRYDHRDVINSLLITGSCLENLKEYDRAEDWYRTLLKEYPYSRYVGEGHVKIARIHRNRAIQRLGNGLKILNKGNVPEGRKNAFEGFQFIQESLNHYQSAIQEDAFSVWATYAQNDLKGLNEILERLKGQWGAVSNHADVVEKIEHLRKKLSEIQQLSV